MAVSSQQVRSIFTGNGVSTDFATGFMFLAASHLRVFVNQVLKANGTDYTVSGAGNPLGGTVSFASAPSAGAEILIFRETALIQETDYTTNDPFPAESHERALDKLTLIAQEMAAPNGLLDRALKYPNNEPVGFTGTLPSKAARSQKFLGFDADGKPVALNGTGADPGTIDTPNLANGAVTEPKLANDAVTDSKLANDAVTEPKLANGAVTEPKLANGAVTAAKLGFPYSGRNLLINGNFDVAQRGIAIAAGTGIRYCADRWYTNANGTTIEAAVQGFVLGQTEVPGAPRFFHRAQIVSAAGAGNFAFVAQAIEQVTRLGGQTVTVSFWARANATRFMAVSLTQHFGTGGSPSNNVNVPITKVELDTTWRRFEVTVNVPSLINTSLGTNANDYTSVAFWMDAGSDFHSITGSLGHQSGTFDLANVQVEFGPNATEFERVHPASNLMLCQRYYYQATKLIRGGPGTGEWYQLLSHPQVMRAAPTMTKAADLGSVNSTFTGFFNSRQEGVEIGQALSAPNGYQFLVMTGNAELVV